MNQDANSASFTQQTPPTPALYTYNVYSTTGCAGTPIVSFINIPLDGSCVASTIPFNIASITLVNSPPSTTTVTLNVGAIVGAVLGGLAVIVGLVFFCRYKELLCFAKPGFTPTTVMNPAAIVVK